MFLRMLSYYISWHMKAALAPILFVDNDKPAAAAKRANPVAAAQRSDEALAKAARKRTTEDTPGAQLHQPARRFGHPLRQPDPAHRPTWRRSPCPPAPPHYSGGPSNSSTCPTATAWRSQCNHPTQRKTPAQRPNPSPHQGTSA